MRKNSKVEDVTIFLSNQSEKNATKDATKTKILIRNNMKKFKLSSGGHPLTTYAKFFEKLTFLTPWYALVRVYQGVRNVSFSENFACVRNVMDGPPRQVSSTESDIYVIHWFYNDYIVSTGFTKYNITCI